MNRHEALNALADRILQIERPHPVRVAIDGVSAAGKTTLADEVARTLANQSRPVIRATVDDFHNPPEVRYRQGRMSPEGYYHDAFDHPSLRSLLLEPLGLGGSRRYRIGALGQPDGSAIVFKDQTAATDAILLVDGAFLSRPELNDCWDYRIFVEVDQRIAMERGIVRDAARMGGEAVARERYEQRYVPGERLYLDTVRPWQVADVIVTNEDLSAPQLRFKH